MGNMMIDQRFFWLSKVSKPTVFWVPPVDTKQLHEASLCSDQRVHGAKA